jgi:hypothetical protein
VDSIVRTTMRGFHEAQDSLVELGGNPRTASRTLSHVRTTVSPRQTGEAMVVRSTSGDGDPQDIVT